jgi:hypothetical protein
MSNPASADRWQSIIQLLTLNPEAGATAVACG